MLRPSFLAGLALALSALVPRTAPAATPAACPNPNALGIAREMAVGGGARVGLKTYPQTLALADHEVVLTFDDGPLPATTPRVLDALAAQCVKATFFLIGRNTAAAPALAKREFEEGHSIGHHSFSHPAVTLRGLTNAEALADIDKGMAADDAAVYGADGGGVPHVPFFRFPGFADTPPLLDALQARGIAVFGADLWASDWVPMTPEAELKLLMARLDAAGRGIILLHDARPQTAAMLPRFLEALKAKGYRVVHVVPGAGPTPTRSAPAGWTSETERIIAHVWPKIERARSAHALGLKGAQP